MKNRIISLLLAFVFVLSMTFSFSACTTEEEPSVTPIPDEPRYDGSKEDVMTELSDISLGEVLDVFENAIAENSDIGALLGAYKFSAQVPPNMFMKDKGTTKIYINDGILSVFNNEEELYLAAKDGRLSSVIRSEKKTDGMYIVGGTEQGSVVDGALGAIIMLDEYLSFAEEHFGIGLIEEDDLEAGESGFYFLSDSYMKELAVAVLSAAYCIENGITAEEFSATDEETASQIKANAEELVGAFSPRIGIGLKMRRINAIRLAINAPDVKEYTEGELSSASVDVLLNLNLDRTRVEKCSAEFNLVSDEHGSLEAKIAFENYYNSLDELTSLKLSVDASAQDARVHLKETKSEDNVIVKGNRTLSVDILYNGSFNTTGGNLISFLYENQTSPKSLEYGEDATVTPDEEERFMNAKNYNEFMDIKLYRDEARNGKIAFDVKKGTASATFSGSFIYGDAAEKYELPSEIEDMLLGE